MSFLLLLIPALMGAVAVAVMACNVLDRAAPGGVAGPVGRRCMDCFSLAKKKKHAESLWLALRPTANARRFAGRAEEFLLDGSGGTNSTPCDPRFFMTWFSPSSAFGRRELLSMQSVFMSHPAACLLLLSDSLDSPAGEALLHPLSSQGYRVAALSPDLDHLLASTPAEHWLSKLREGAVDPGGVPFPQNLSNLLRLAVLYKYGGVYLDADVIVLRSFSPLQNCVGAQSADRRTGAWTRLNNAVMVFDRGHPSLLDLIGEFASTFNGSRWGHNGPYLVSRVAAREREQGREGFAVLPPSAFYPVDWVRVGKLFEGRRDKKHERWVAETARRIKNHSFALHLWNRQSKGFEVGKGSVLQIIIAHTSLLPL